jgi:hypothetical protein
MVVIPLTNFVCLSFFLGRTVQDGGIVVSVRGPPGGHVIPTLTSHLQPFAIPLLVAPHLLKMALSCLPLSF